MNVKLVTTHGDIIFKLYNDKTPDTVTNFLNYARDGFYNNTLFHRVIDNFMIQGGGLSPELVKKPTLNPIQNEADKGGPNKRGTIAMARTSDPHSATSQFFINVSDNNFLNFKDKTENGWGYCVFGEVTDGMDVVDKIKSVKTTTKSGHQDVPLEDVVITQVVVENTDA